MPKLEKIVRNNHNLVAQDLSSMLMIQEIRAMTHECMLALLHEEHRLSGPAHYNNHHLLVQEINRRA